MLLVVVGLAGGLGLTFALADTNLSVSVKYYDQCSNDDDDGYATGDTGCRWVNGNIQSSNSVYYEGDATVQRLLLEDVAAGSHTVTFQYDTTKGGKHAYDFLTTDTHSELAPNPLTNADICDGAASSKLSSCASISPAPDTANSAIPQDPNANNFDNFARHFRIRNGIIDSVSTPTVVSGSYSGDSTTSITVTFHADPNTCVNGYNAGNNQNPIPACAVLISFGAHISEGADWGAGTTAVNIEGSPYHVALKNIDGTAIGQRDNQMQASAVVVPNTITIHKVTDPSSDTTTNFTYTTSGTGYTGFSLTGGTQNQQTVTPGNYTVTESNPGPTFALTNLVCSASGTGTSATPNLSTRSVSITVGQAGGGIVDCTYTNTLQVATLTLVKNVENNNGGNAAATDWTLAASGPTPISGTSGSSSVTSASVLVGSYNLSESGGPAGYTASDYSCVKNQGSPVSGNSIDLAYGDSAVCTITNNDIAPSLTLIKQVINDNGGTAVVGDWTLTATGVNSQDVVSGTTPVQSGATFQADSYTLSESGPAGYSASAWSCVGGTQNGSQITLAIAESATCTITNNDIAPTLTVIKVVDNGNTGATFTAADFQMMVNGGNVAQNVANTFPVGSYAVTESGPNGYTMSFSGDCDTSGNVSLALADNKTCTVTNTAIAPTLKLVKTVINDNGGQAQISDFTLQIDGNAVTNDTAVPVTVGTHAASEITLSGYTPSAWGTDCTAAGSVTLALAENKVCTITNDDQPGTLRVIKVVINDNGGTKVFEDFTFSVNADSAVAFENDGQNDLTVNAGAYSVTEPTVSGYATSYDNCSNLNIPNGGMETCTITNNDIQPRLTVTKIVINDNGGQAVVTDFPLFVDASQVVSGVQNGFNVGSYIVSETTVPGYTPSIGGDCDANGNVSLALADVKACTITNDDVAPTLTLIKNVINDDGGNAVVSDFPLFINGNPVTSGSSNALNANTLYTATETTLSGYTPSSWSGDCATDGTITLAPGENKTCTITNNDVAPTLTLIKNVINDNGGTAGVNDFGLTVGGSSVTSGQVSTVAANTAYALNEAGLTGYSFVSLAGDTKCPAVLGGTVALDEGENVTCTITNDDIAPTLTLVKTVVNDNGGNAVVADFPLFINGNSVVSGTANTLSANTLYTATETNLFGYIPSSWAGDCAANGTITLQPGDAKTCTITNDDIAPTLTLVKSVINNNGGTAGVNDFGLSIDSIGVSSGQVNIVTANTPIVLNEAGLTGYAFVSLTGDAECPTVLAGSATLDEGENVTCTITNDDIPAHLIVIKTVINDHNGTNVAADFTMNIAGVTAFGGNSFAGVASHGVDKVLTSIGSYSVTETGPTGYNASFSADCTGSIALGETKTCTITNDDIAPPVTRTQGFWQTHYTFTTSVYNAADPIWMICPSRSISSSSVLFGGFFSSISKTTTGAKRSSLDQARMQLMQQLLAAILNHKAFGSGDIAMINAAKSAYCGTNRAAILNQAGILDAFNNSGDSLPTTMTTGKADPKVAQMGANRVTWNVLP